MHPTTKWTQARVLPGTTAVTALAYVGFLGWHDLQNYERWEVAGFAGVLAVVVGWVSTRMRIALLAAGSITLTVTFLWSIDTATDNATGGAGLWPIGAAGIAVLTGAASALLAVSAVVARDTLRRRPA